MTLAELHRNMTASLAEAGIETAALDARWLLAGTLGLDRAAIMLTPDLIVGGDAIARIEAAMRRRLSREPVSRILGRREFHGLEFEISPSTLDPRPDTETLVDGVLALVRSGCSSGGSSPRIADLGTGSGAILIAILHSLPTATGVAVDIDPDALAVAAGNARRLGVASRMEFVRSSWMERVTGPFDIVVSNPPYIPAAAIADLEADVRVFDPRLALDGGSDGLEAYRALIPEALPQLADGGWLALEIGLGQESEVAEIVNNSLMPGRTADFRFWDDLTGRKRCVAARSRKI